jgi:hypothetical protein
MARVTGRWIGAAVLAVVLGFAGCEAEQAAGATDITGTYTDAFGGRHVITREAWTQSYEGSADLVFHLTKWDEAAHRVVGQNDAANAFGGGQWSRFDWASKAAVLYICQTRYDAASEAEALAATAADAADPTAGGCGGFPWTALAPAAD